VVFLEAKVSGGSNSMSAKRAAGIESRKRHDRRGIIVDRVQLVRRARSEEEEEGGLSSE